MGNSLSHETGTDEFSIPDDEVHIWLASLDLEPDPLRQLEATLAPEERRRAARFFHRRDQDRFIGSRGILRDLLSKYTAVTPDRVEIRYAAQGKPFIDNSGSGLRISFNLSHSHGVAVYAIARRREVGIDVELVQPEFAGSEIAERFFSANEIAELHSLPSDLRAEGFFLCWTRKEAYVKARGEGLHIPLDCFDVTLSPGQPEKLTSDDSDRWTLHSYQPVSGYVAAIVVEGKDWQPRHRKWKA